MDTYGDASKFYSLSKLTFVGGSLIMHGGQNPLEPARRSIFYTVLISTILKSLSDVREFKNSK